VNQGFQPIFELSSAPCAVWIRECQANTPRRVMRTNGFACESSEVACARRFYLSGLSIAPSDSVGHRRPDSAVRRVTSPVVDPMSADEQHPGITTSHRLLTAQSRFVACDFTLVGGG
jgi:hypothetical protein